MQTVSFLTHNKKLKTRRYRGAPKRGSYVSIEEKFSITIEY